MQLFWTDVLKFHLLLCLHHPTLSAKTLFSGCPSAAFICWFVRTDLVITISHEWLEQSRWNLRRVFTSSYWWYVVRFWRSKVKVTAGRVGVKASTLTLGCQSPSSSSLQFGSVKWPLSTICIDCLRMEVCCLSRRILCRYLLHSVLYNGNNIPKDWSVFLTYWT